jgi:hypothetical protein
MFTIRRADVIHPRDGCATFGATLIGIGGSGDGVLHRRWVVELSIHRQDIGSVAGVCIDLGATLPDGSDSGTAGGQLTSAVIGGIVTAKAHEVRVVFRDGKHSGSRSRPARRRGAMC